MPIMNRAPPDDNGAHMQLRFDEDGKAWMWNYKTEQWEYDAQLAAPFEKRHLN